jgi:membrane protein involved in colicin uptake
MVDATKVLRTFACDCAERVLKHTNVTDERSWNAIKISRLYNEGKATREELAAARAAARDAARDAASDAARDAAWDAERAWQKRHLNKLMKQLLEGK